MSSQTVLFVVTSHITATTFLVGQLSHLREQGWNTHVISAPGPGLLEFCEREGATLHPVPMQRRPSPLDDLRSLVQLAWTIRSIDPDVIVAGTPKAGLLAGMAGWAVRVPRRIYLVHGLRFEGLEGLKRSALVALERVSARSATELVAVSSSVRAGLVSAGIPGARSVHVLGAGSPNGVDTERFRPPSDAERAEARRRLEIPAEARVALFVGRLTRDKGLADLEALAGSLAEGERLVAVGDPEPLNEQDRLRTAALERHPRVILRGHADDVTPYYRAADLLVLPTRREGLPTVILEAGASALPTVSYAVTGVVDAAEPGRTAVLVPWGSSTAFVQESTSLLRDRTRARAMGAQARQHITQMFDRHAVWQAWQEHLDPT